MYKIKLQDWLKDWPCFWQKFWHVVQAGVNETIEFFLDILIDLPPFLASIFVLGAFVAVIVIVHSPWATLGFGGLILGFVVTVARVGSDPPGYEYYRRRNRY